MTTIGNQELHEVVSSIWTSLLARAGCRSTAAGTAASSCAIGEVANIAAGNLKALMPDACTLGLPVVSEASYADAEASSREGVQQQARFESAGDSFIVTLIAEH